MSLLHKKYYLYCVNLILALHRCTHRQILINSLFHSSAQLVDRNVKIPYFSPPTTFPRIVPCKACNIRFLDHLSEKCAMKCQKRLAELLVEWQRCQVFEDLEFAILSRNRKSKLFRRRRPKENLRGSYDIPPSSYFHRIKLLNWGRGRATAFSQLGPKSSQSVQ